MPRYELEDLDVDAFARQWLEGLEDDGARMRSLVDEKPDMGPYFMLANIAPRAGEPAASTEEQVLFAVLAAYQDAVHSKRLPERSWEGTTAHLNAAFAYANEIGRTGVASSLLESVVRRDEDGFSRSLTARSLGNDPGKIAAHEQEMAGILSRDIRAAGLLDPSLSIDTLLLEDAPDD
jgi:hypothetical protein